MNNVALTIIVSSLPICQTIPMPNMEKIGEQTSQFFKRMFSDIKDETYKGICSNAGRGASVVAIGGVSLGVYSSYNSIRDFFAPSPPPAAEVHNCDKGGMSEFKDLLKVNQNHALKCALDCSGTNTPECMQIDKTAFDLLKTKSIDLAAQFYDICLRRSPILPQCRWATYDIFPEIAAANVELAGKIARTCAKIILLPEESRCHELGIRAFDVLLALDPSEAQIFAMECAGKNIRQCNNIGKVAFDALAAVDPVKAEVFKIKCKNLNTPQCQEINAQV